jgi:hypothetical protein
VATTLSALPRHAGRAIALVLLMISRDFALFYSAQQERAGDLGWVG